MSFPYNYYLNYNAVQQHRFESEEPEPAARGRAQPVQLGPDATQSSERDEVDPGQEPGAGAKAVGGGLEAGTTDTGPSTAPMGGGHGGAGSDSYRTTEAGSAGGAAPAPVGGGGTFGPAPRGGAGMTAAGGNSVLSTGRPASSDRRAGIGSAAVSGGGNPDIQERGHLQPGSTTRSAAGTSGVGTIGGGTAGHGTSGTRDRATDITQGRIGGPEEDLARTGNPASEESGGGFESAPDEIPNQSDPHGQEKPNPSSSSRRHDLKNTRYRPDLNAE